MQSVRLPAWLAMKENQTNIKPESSASPEGKEAVSREPPYPPTGYSWYVVGVLMVFYILSFVDRQIIALLVEPKHRGLGR